MALFILGNTVNKVISSTSNGQECNLYASFSAKPVRSIVSLFDFIVGSLFLGCYMICKWLR